MRLLIINQHTSNRGDEALGKSFLRALNNKYIDILYSSAPKLDGDEKIECEDKVIIHHASSKFTVLNKIIVLLTFILPFFIIERFIFLSPTLYKEMKLIKNSDKVISASGGVNIGPYQDWVYLWRIYISLKLKKDTAIYSVSFGPLPDNYFFKKTSIYVLKNIKFLSLRENKSESYADELSIPYTSSVDTVFLNRKNNLKISDTLSSQLPKHFVVIMLNEAYRWHKFYKDISPDTLDFLYVDIINKFTSKDINILMLPHLFGNYSQGNDKKYLENIKSNCDFENKITVLDDIYNSDIYQKIIEQADFVIGARYHAIIFSINNNTPFYSLSYEHKMTNLLEVLDLKEFGADLLTVLNNEDKYKATSAKIFETYNNRAQNKTRIDHASIKAKKIAGETFNKFESIFLKT